MRLIDRLIRPTEERVGMVQVFPTWKSLSEASLGSFADAYRQDGVVFATVLARMKVFSEVRFAWRRFRDGGLWTNDALGLLQRPWPGGTESELLGRMQQDVSLAGNAFVHLAGDRLQRLDPTKVEIMSNGRDKTGYLYFPNGYGQGDGIAIRAEEMAHWMPIPDPEKNFAGMSWLSPVISEIRSDLKMTRHQGKFFDNAATPNMFVKIEGSLKPESRELLKSELDRKYGGWENAYKTIVLDQGADMKVVGADFKQMDFVNAMAANESRIATAGSVPPIIIGLKAGLDAATYSNYGMAMRAFADHTIRPDWNSVVAALGQIVPAPSGSELWFDDSHVAALRQDASDEATIRSTDAQTIRAYVDAGFTPESAVLAVDNDDLGSLVHTGLYSVQLQPPNPDNTNSADIPA